MPVGAEDTATLGELIQLLSTVNSTSRLVCAAISIPGWGGALLSFACRLVRCLLGLLPILVRSDMSKDVELLVLRYKNQVLLRSSGWPNQSASFTVAGLPHSLLLRCGAAAWTAEYRRF
jgi:hypothetical protein